MECELCYSEIAGEPILVKPASGKGECALCSDDCRAEWEDEARYQKREELDGMFTDPGGRSALRAESPDNPRDLPCPTCGEPDRLTPADRARGYQCNACADAAERGV